MGNFEQNSQNYANPAYFHLKFEIFLHILAVQLPPGSIHTFVACGPHSPRPKDCLGLGDPNTLKPIEKLPRI